MEWNYIFGDFASSMGGRGGEMLYSLKNLDQLKKCWDSVAPQKSPCKKNILESPPFIKKKMFYWFLLEEMP